MNLLRSDFLKDAIVLIILTIIIASFLAFVTGEIVEAYFNDSLTSILGDYGEYDFALIVDAEVKDEAYQQAQKIIEREFNDAQLYQSMELAGKANFFLKLGEEDFTASNLADANGYFREISGYNSLSLIAEPRISVDNVTEQGANILKEEIASWQGVDFSFFRANKLEIILTDFKYQRELEQKVESLLTEYELLTINTGDLAKDFEYDPYLIQEEVLLQHSEIIELTPEDDAFQQLAQNLSVLSEFIAEYDLNEEDRLISETLDDVNAFMSRLDYEADFFASLVKIEGQLKDLEQGMNLTQEGLLELKQVTTQVDSFLDTLIINLEQLDFLFELEAILSSFGYRDSNLIDYITEYNNFMNRLLEWQANIQEVKGLLAEVETVSEVETAQLRQLNTALIEAKDIFIHLEGWDFTQEIEKLVYIEEVLATISDEEAVSAFKQLDQYIKNFYGSGDELLFLLPAGSDEEDFIVDFKTAYGIDKAQINYNISNWGLITPDLRGEIYRILTEVRVLLIIIVVLIITALSLIFDQSLIINFLKLIAINQEKSVLLALLYSMLIGAVIFSSSIYLIGLDLYYLPNYIIPLPGLLLGLIIYSKAEKLNEVKISEFKAGLALGFSYCEILQQIVIPAAKPGLLYMINQRRSYF